MDEEKRTIVKFQDHYYKYNTKLTKKQIDFLQWLNDHDLLAQDVTFDIFEGEEEFYEP